LNLTVKQGERLVLVGPSGCGKSTTLRLVAGLERPDRGQVQFDQQDVTAVPPARRHVGLLFQGENLFPHLNVHDNLAIGLRMRRQPESLVRERVATTTQLLDLHGLLLRWPHDLSGGERQRVALGRMLANQTPLCLLDEPLSNIDPAQRNDLRQAIRKMHRQTQATMIYVTHDQVEAMTLGERIAVMCAGRLIQVDTPDQTYRSPANTFVARFIGSSPMNLFSGYVADRRLGGLNRQIDISVDLADGPVMIGIRPERLSDTQPGSIRVAGTIEAVEYLGAEQTVRLVHGDQTIAARLDSAREYREGQHIELRCEAADVLLFADDTAGQFLCRVTDASV
jgi:ABC-type sugar transport system ATPase subunit